MFVSSHSHVRHDISLLTCISLIIINATNGGVRVSSVDSWSYILFDISHSRSVWKISLEKLQHSGLHQGSNWVHPVGRSARCSTCPMLRDRLCARTRRISLV